LLRRCRQPPLEVEALSRRPVAGVLMWLVGVPLIAYLMVLAYLYVFQRQLLYFPDPTRPQLGLLAQLGVREVQLTTADGLALLSWYLPAREGRPVILYFQGNGGNIGHRAERLQRFASEGYGVLLVGYRGYGGNPGRPTEVGFYQDALAAYDFLQREGIAATRFALYGESLGTGIAVYLAATQQIGGLILESPYTSVAALAQYHYPFVPATITPLFPPLFWSGTASTRCRASARSPRLFWFCAAAATRSFRPASARCCSTRR
jgi:uncharacterized protein